MRAAIVIVTFNHAAIVGACLRAVLATVTADVETIVVDNASSDGTGELVRCEFPGVRVVASEHNTGYGGGNNLGAAHARGEVLVFLNPDTQPRAGWLEPLLAALEDDHVGLVTPKLLLASDPSRIDTLGNEVHLSGITPSRKWGEPSSAHTQTEEVSAISGACFAVRREVFEQLGGFDARYFLYYEDTDLSLRARLAGHRCVAVPASEVLHDHRPGFSPQKLRYLERNRYWTLLKLFELPTLVALVPTLLLAELLAWGMALKDGPRHIAAKARSWVDLLRWLPRLASERRAARQGRRIADSQLLRQHTTGLHFGQAVGGKAGRMLEAPAGALFAGGRALFDLILRGPNRRTQAPGSGRLRVGHVTATFPPYWSGAGLVAWHLAREQSRMGHMPLVVTAAPPRRTHVAAETSTEDPPGVRVHRLTPLVRLGNAPLLVQLPRLLGGCDVIHLHYPFISGAELTAITALVLRVPMIVSYHNDLVAGGVRGALFRAYSATAGRWSLQRAARLLAVSAEHLASSRASDAATWPATRVAELPNGVDLDLFTPDASAGRVFRARHSIPEDLPLLAFVGTLDAAHHYRRLDVLLDALDALARDGLAPGLVVAGGGPWLDRYVARAEASGLRDRVWFLGAVPHGRLPDVYRAADLLVLPSERQESFGMVVIESLACGTPVVASNLPGVRSVITSTGGGVLARPGSSASLAAAIRPLLTDAPRRRALGEAGRDAVVARFAWPDVTERVVAEYRAALRREGDRPAGP